MEPELRGRPERLSLYVAYFRSQFGNDPRLFAFDVSAAHEDGQVALTGYVEFPETRSGLQEFLAALGFTKIDNQLKTLPTDELGEETFGLVTTTHAFSYASPEAREVVTDCLLGEPLYLLRQEGDWLLVHSGEGYLGYVAASSVRRVDQATYDRHLDRPRVRLIADHQVNADLTAPVGAALPLVTSEGFRVELPTGDQVDLPPAKCELIVPSTAKVEDVIAAARQFLGTEYVWGGKASSGIDCSGLVQVAYTAGGVQLPRDANQQFNLGQLVATRSHRSGLRRGDTLYFIGPAGKIRHTALYLGDDKYIHAQQPFVGINSLNPEDDDYSERRAKSFAFAKRLWDAAPSGSDSTQRTVASGDPAAK